LSSTTLRLLGILLTVAAAVLAILNLKRVADAGTFWLVAPVLIIGLGLIALSRRRR
jgi:MYXO-CTERM domain-containing protein